VGDGKKQVPARLTARNVAWSSPSVQRKQAIAHFSSDRPQGEGNMPPDSKDLSSLKGKSLSFHRLHATDLDRMKGIYLSAEELRGFDKYKVQLDRSIGSLVLARTTEY